MIRLSEQDWSYLLDGATSLVLKMMEALNESSAESDPKPQHVSGTVLLVQLGDTEWSVNTDTEAKLWISARSIYDSSVTQ